ncbi:MAG: hypothetical protein LBT81_02750 [Helicobacteraceae bacterium]|jgi:ABC-type multidrug transport system fused ATPase/permease subunit|nr:hypothetical protein [Helicobacteraceae bacterium]
MNVETGAVSGLALRFVLSVLLVCVLMFSLFGRDKSYDLLFAPIDNRAKTYLEDTLTQTAIVYGTVRGIHAVISVIKGTQVHPPFVTLSLGEALNPAEDLIEQLSDVLLIAIASLGAQRFMMEICSTLGIAVFMSIGCVLLLAGLWLRMGKDICCVWGARLIVFALALRLIVPLMAYGADVAGKMFLQRQLQEAQEMIIEEKNIMGDRVMPGVSDGGFWGSIKTLTGTDVVSKYLDMFKKRVESLLKSLMTLFTLFVFQSLIFPLVSLWVLVKLFTGFLPK